MQPFLAIAVLTWLFGFSFRLLGQSDSARHLVDSGELDRMPRWWELVNDAALWWLWMAFDAGRWIRKWI